MEKMDKLGICIFDRRFRYRRVVDLELPNKQIGKQQDVYEVLCNSI